MEQASGRPCLELYHVMSLSMQELLEQSSFDKLKEGAIVPGTITEIRQNEVVVDIGGKSEGVIPASEFMDIGDLQIGSTIEVMVDKLEDKNAPGGRVPPRQPLRLPAFPGFERLTLRGIV